MLHEYKQIYARRADELIKEDWRKMNKNTIFFRYSEFEKSNPKLAEAYLAAAIVRYWNIISNYYKAGNGAYEPEDVYFWLVHVMTWATKHQPWKRGGSMEDDPNGPDKYINVCMQSRRQGFYQWSNAKKRAAYFTQSSSLEKLLEDSGDSKIPIKNVVDNQVLSMDLQDLVRNNFNQKKYMGAFILDGIINAPVIDTIKEIETYPDSEQTYCKIYTQFNKKKLSKHIRSMDNNYCKIFSKLYNIPESDVMKARDECVKISSSKIYSLLKSVLENLKKSVVLER